MKKILIALLVFILAVSSAACSKTPKRTDEFLDNFETVTDKDTPSWEFDRVDYDLTWFIDAPWMVWPTYGADLVSRTIYEKTGCKIQFSVAGDYLSSELSTMLSSEQLPDVLTIQAASIYANQLPDQDYVWSLDTLMDRFAPSMTDRYRVQQKDVYDWFKQDGALYGIPNLSYSDYYHRRRQADAERCNSRAQGLVRGSARADGRRHDHEGELSRRREIYHR